MFDTLADRITRAFRLEPAVFHEIAADANGTAQSITVAAIAFAIGGLGGDGGFLGNLIGGAIGGVIGLIIWSGVVLLIGKLFSGQGSYTELLRVLGFTSAPMAITFIPFVGIVGVVYSIIMQVRAVREIHKISDGAAVVIVLIPWVIFFVIALVIAIAIGAALFGLAVGS